MVSTFTLNIVLSFYHNVPGQLSYSGLINFDRFEVESQSDCPHQAFIFNLLHSYIIERSFLYYSR